MYQDRSYEYQCDTMMHNMVDIQTFLNATGRPPEPFMVDIITGLTHHDPFITHKAMIAAKLMLSKYTKG